MESKVRRAGISKCIGFFAGIAISVYSLVNYFIIFAKYEHGRNEIYMAVVSTVIILLDLIFYLATVLPDKIKMKLFKNAFSASNFARSMMFLIMLSSAFYGLFYISPTRVITSFDDIESAKYILLPFFLLLFYVSVYLCERTLFNKMVVGIISGVFIISTAIAVLQGFSDYSYMYLYLPHCFFAVVITYDVSVMAKLSNLVYFKTKTAENENGEEICLYRIFAEKVDGKKIEYYKNYSYNKYYYTVEGDDTIYDADSSNLGFSRRFAVISHEMNCENVNMHHEYL